MAISKDKSLITSGFSGKIGNALLKQYSDKVVLSAIPDMSRRVLSAKQLELNMLMKRANMYAKEIMTYRDVKAEACQILNVPPNKVYKALVKDYIQKKGDRDKLIKFTQDPCSLDEMAQLGHS